MTWSAARPHPKLLVREEGLGGLTFTNFPLDGSRVFFFLTVGAHSLSISSQI